MNEKENLRLEKLPSKVYLLSYEWKNSKGETKTSEEFFTKSQILKFVGEWDVEQDIKKFFILQLKSGEVIK